MYKKKKISVKPVKKAQKVAPKKFGKLSKKIKSVKKTFRAYKSRTRILIKNPSFIKISFICLLILTIAGSIFYFTILKDLPNPNSLVNNPSAATTIIRDRNGQILYKVYKDANRIKLNWDEIPENIKKATLAIEDDDFYRHHGVSLRSILRAFIHNLSQKNATFYQGGSTITQQLIKNRLVGPEKTYIRKIKEIILSFWTETRFAKNEIFNMYLNEVGYGGPAYGIQAAAQTYFGIDAKNLSLAQSAFLAGVPAAPTTFSPFGINPQLAFTREIDVLDRMLKLKMINQIQYDDAKNEKIVFIKQKIDLLAPHFVMFVKDQLVQKLGEDRMVQGGMDVTTTLDLSIEKTAEEIVEKQIAQIRDIYNIHNAGALVTNPATGEILAMVGSPDYFDIQNKGYVNAITAKRQPGSAIKPVNYAYAFDHGYSPNSTIDDSPVVYTAPGISETYTPKNYDGKFHGTVTLRAALANSYNVPAVKVLNSYGVDKMVEEGKNMGIKTWNEKPLAGLSLTLGGAEVTMLDMARAYGTIANLGVMKELKFIKEIRDENDKDITNLRYENNKNISLAKEAMAIDIKSSFVPINENNPSFANATAGEQVISPLSAYWLTDILADDLARLPAFGPYAKLTVPGHKIAVKTGTSNNFRDNWTMGFTPSYLTVVWVGNNDGSFMNKNLVSGITGAAPIWNEIMSALLKGKPKEDFPIPSGLIPVRICAVNGLLTCPYCPNEKTEYFTADKIPTQKCFFKSPAECEGAKKQAEGKSDEEKKQIMVGCPVISAGN